jgi:hypothetical protein
LKPQITEFLVTQLVYPVSTQQIKSRCSTNQITQTIQWVIKLWTTSQILRDKRQQREGWLICISRATIRHWKIRKDKTKLRLEDWMLLNRKCLLYSRIRTIGLCICHQIRSQSSRNLLVKHKQILTFQETRSSKMFPTKNKEFLIMKLYLKNRLSINLDSL